MTDESRGLLYNFTGGGKGKTSAALGVALRAIGWNWKIAVLQFLKSPDFPTGELNFFRKRFPEILFECGGLGLVSSPGDHGAAVRRTWSRAETLLREFDGELLILDELNTAISLEFLPESEVIRALSARSPALNVLVTGRNSPEGLLAISDLVTEMREIKHPFRAGIPARKGLDY